MTKDEALKLALEALEDFLRPLDADLTRAINRIEQKTRIAITAIREALASSVATNDTSQERVDETVKQRHEEQPEQEPVAWSYWQSCLNDDGTQTAPWVHRLSKFKPSESIINKDIAPLYTTPPQHKPLTRKEVLAIIDKHPSEKKTGLPMFYRDQVLDIARAIEAAHGIKGEA